MQGTLHCVVRQHKVSGQHGAAQPTALTQADVRTEACRTDTSDEQGERQLCTILFNSNGLRAGLTYSERWPIFSSSTEFKLSKLLRSLLF